MEIINVEARTWESMMSRFEAFAEKVDKICSTGDDKGMEKWLDNQDVCQILNISKRTSRHTETMGRWHFLKSITKYFTNPKM